MSKIELTQFLEFKTHGPQWVLLFYPQLLNKKSNMLNFADIYLRSLQRAKKLGLSLTVPSLQIHLLKSSMNFHYAFNISMFIWITKNPCQS